MNFVATLLPRLLLGLLISSLIGLVAYRRGSLSKSGVLGAVLTGTTIFGFGGFTAGVLLVAFFVSSSLLSHFKQNSQQKQRAAEMFDKGGQRDIWQALANGGAAAVFAVISGVLKETGINNPDQGNLVAYTALLGALATVNADTWATELGVLSKSKPRLITTFRSVAAGVSGGISVMGLVAALVGAGFIAICYLAFNNLDGPIIILGGPGVDIAYFERMAYWKFRYAPAIACVVGGFLGSLCDSFLGATAQAIYYSDPRQKETEKAVENDGDDPSRIVSNKLIRGWKWLNNDWVNFISSVVGALVAAGLVTLIL